MQLEPPRRLQSCLAAATIYLTIAAIILGIRLVLVDRGFPMALWELRALRFAIVSHTVAGLLTGVGCIVAGLVKSTPSAASRIALALLPVVVLASLDRFAAVSFEPLPAESIMAPHPMRLWTYRPHWKEQADGRVVKINSKGLRNPEIPIDKADDEQRIVFLGDSITAAQRVEEREGFVRLVENLARAANGNPRVTTISCAVAGYSPWQQVNLLQEECIDYDPDVVVHVFCLNDVGDRYQLVPFGGTSHGLRPAQPGPLEWSGLFRMTRHLVSALVAVPYGLGKTKVEQVYSVERVINEPRAPEIRAAWNQTLDKIATMHEFCKQRGVRFALVVFPFAEQASPFVSADAAPQAILKSFTESRDLPFLDLLPMYRAHCAQPEVLERTGNGWEGLDVMPDRAHPTREGHVMAAKDIYRFLVESGLVE